MKEEYGGITLASAKKSKYPRGKSGERPGNGDLREGSPFSLSSPFSLFRKGSAVEKRRPETGVRKEPWVLVN